MAGESRRSRFDPYGRDGIPPPPSLPGRDRSPLRGDPYADRYPPPPRDPYRSGSEKRDDSYDRRDPYAEDPYRRPPPPRDPYRDDPYRRDPYRDPYREMAPPAPAKPREPEVKRPPYECEIIALTQQQRGYAEMIERRVKALNVLTKVTLLSDDIKDVTLPVVIEEATLKGVLFAINISSQNEVHRSLTLNILHGTPQEHRNMPLDDAVTLISRNFEDYIKALLEKGTSVGGVPPKPVVKPPTGGAGRYAGFTPPDGELTYLLNLLADKRQLTLDEIEKVLSYVKLRRDQQIEAEGGLPLSKAAVKDTTTNQIGGRLPGDPAINDQQQELQAKILSILNGAGPGSQAMSTNPATGSSSSLQNPYGSARASTQYPISQQTQSMYAGRQVPPGPPQNAPSSSSTSINFDNPSVQRALDSLISTGPNLLRNMSGGTSSTPKAAAPVMSSSMMGGSRLPPAQMTPGGMGDMSRQAYPGMPALGGTARSSMAPPASHYPPSQQLRY